MKFVVFDAGPLISLTLSGLLDILEKIKTKEIEFIITPQVEREVIDRAINIKKYKLEAIKIRELIEKKILRRATDFLDSKELVKETSDCINRSKRLIFAGKEGINLVQEGEASCIAFTKLTKEDSLIVIDERTTRLISESIENLKIIMERKLHFSLRIDKKELDYFKGLKYVRSSEIVFLAFKRDLIDLRKNNDTLEALLYSLKFNGAAISSREIEEMKGLWA